MSAEVDAEAIVYLRPQTDEAIAILNLKGNETYKIAMIPLREPSDIPLEGIPEFTSHFSPPIPKDLDPASFSLKSILGPYAVHPRVCRLGFNTNNSHSTRGFVLGPRSDANFKISSPDCVPEIDGNYFRIH